MKVRGFHWIVGRFDVRRRTVLIYDSFCSKVPSAEQLVIEKFLPSLLQQWNPKLSGESSDVSWERKYSSIERQPDEHSSGIYMLAILDAILLGFSPSGIRISHRLLEVRECIAEDLLVCGVQKKELLEAYPELLNKP